MHSSRSSGMGSKSREVLVPALIAASLFANRGDAPASVPVFQSVRRPAYPLTDLPSILSPKRRPSAPASTPPLRFTGCATPMRRTPSTMVQPLTLVSATSWHADPKTTSVYAHARPGRAVNAI